MSDQNTRLGFFGVALVSAILNFAGFSQAVDEGWFYQSLAAVAAIGVFIALFLFWSHALDVIPKLMSPEKRLAGWTSIGCACVLIGGLSGYWNAVALGGSEALRRFYEDLVPRGEQVLAQATTQNAANGSLTFDLNALAGTTQTLADDERDSGTLSGSAGAGAVVATLIQIRDKVQTVHDAVQGAAKTGKEQLDAAEACLAELRSILRGHEPDTSRLNAASAHIDCLNRSAADLINQDVPGMVESAMSGLTTSIVMPVTVRSEAQRQALENSLIAVQSEAGRIAAKAASLRRAPAEPLIVDQPSAIVAVAIYWHAIIPAIATAIAIDLLPLVILILRVIRDRDSIEAGLSPTDWTLSDLADIKKQWQAIQNEDAPTIDGRIETFEPDDAWWAEQETIDQAPDEGAPTSGSRS